MDVIGLIKQVAKEKGCSGVDADVVNICLSNIMFPDDGKMWPRTWRKSDSMVLRVLRDRDDAYWEALKSVEDIPGAMVDEWNRYSRMPVSKRLRVLGAKVRVVSVSNQSKFMWDMIVLEHFRRNAWDNVSLQTVITGSVKGARIEALYPKWVWLWMLRCAPDNSIDDNKTVVSIEVIED